MRWSCVDHRSITPSSWVAWGWLASRLTDNLVGRRNFPWDSTLITRVPSLSFILPLFQKKLSNALSPFLTPCYFAAPFSIHHILCRTLFIFVTLPPSLISTPFLSLSLFLLLSSFGENQSAKPGLSAKIISIYNLLVNVAGRNASHSSTELPHDRVVKIDWFYNSYYIKIYTRFSSFSIFLPPHFFLSF